MVDELKEKHGNPSAAVYFDSNSGTLVTALKYEDDSIQLPGTYSLANLSKISNFNLPQNLIQGYGNTLILNVQDGDTLRTLEVNYKSNGEYQSMTDITPKDRLPKAANDDTKSEDVEESSKPSELKTSVTIDGHEYKSATEVAISNKFKDVSYDSTTNILRLTLKSTGEELEFKNIRFPQNAKPDDVLDI